MEFGLVKLPQDAFLLVLQFIGRLTEDILVLTEVCKLWYEIFNIHDHSIWTKLAEDWRVSLPLTRDTRNLRSKANLKKLFLIAYGKKMKTRREKHDSLLLQAHFLLKQSRDPCARLRRLIYQLFPDLRDFDINWQCGLIENNTLSTLSARYCHLRSVILCIDEFHGNINAIDMGGFSCLMIFAFHGHLSGVRYCVRQGAHLTQRGKLRSGSLLTAEHWAAVRGHQEIFLYLRHLREQMEQKQ
jgi:hypothetical protein